jgi:hypothetical protein
MSDPYHFGERLTMLLKPEQLTREQTEKDRAFQNEIVEIATQRDKLRQQLERVDERLMHAINLRDLKHCEWAGDPSFAIIAPTFELPQADKMTVDEYRSTLVLMKARAARLKELTQRYPVYLVMAGRGYRFQSPQEIVQFVSMLEAEIARYDAAAAAA